MKCPPVNAAPIKGSTQKLSRTSAIDLLFERRALSCGAKPSEAPRSEAFWSDHAARKHVAELRCGDRAESGIAAGRNSPGPWARGDSGGASNPPLYSPARPSGSRSPFRARSTVMRSCPAKKRPRCVGNDGNTIRAVVNKTERDHSYDALARRAIIPTSDRSADFTPPFPDCAVNR